MTQPKDHPEKFLPALVVDGTEMLPAAALPLPLGCKSLKPGRDGGDDWADYAAETLLPRWAVECIRQGLVLGQELEEDCNEDGPFPVETMKQRVDVILRTPGEMDKWKRIVGWGIEIVRNLDVQVADKWNGGLLELLDSSDASPMPKWLGWAWERRRPDVISVAYWDSWVTDAWLLVDAAGEEGLKESDREKAARLVAEAHTYWSNPTLFDMFPHPRMRLYFGDGRWRTDIVSQMVKCLTDLMRPPKERKLDRADIRMIADGNKALCDTCTEKVAADVLNAVRIQAIEAEAQAEVAGAKTREAEAEVRAKEAESRMHQIQADAENDVQKANQERNLAIISRQEADIARLQAENERQSEAEARQRAEEACLRAEEIAHELAKERDDWKQLANEKLGTIDERTRRMLSKKDQRAEQARRNLKAQREAGNFPVQNADLQKDFQAIDRELAKQKKRNLKQAVRTVLKRRGITAEGKIESLRTAYNRAKRR